MGPFVRSTGRRSEHVGVIGAGVSGLTSALALAERGYRVTILEARGSLFAGASHAQSHRMHLGHHYPGDPSGRTARACIEGALAFEERFPGFTAAHPKGWYSFVVRGRSGRDAPPVQRESLITPEAYVRYCESLCQLYADIVAERGSAAAFGPPESISRVLAEREYASIVNMDRIAVGVASTERVIRTSAFGQHLRERIRAANGIDVRTGHEVLAARQTRAGFALSVETHGGARRELEFQQVVNASWTHAPWLDAQLGIDTPLSTVRLRFIVEVELPDRLAREPSMFFTLGEYGNYTNLGQGPDGRARAALFYVPLCDADRTTDANLPSTWRTLLRQGLDQDAQRRIGRDIVGGLCIFVPELEDSRVLATATASVITRGDADINDPRSRIHDRYECGVSMPLPGWHSVNIAKFTYCAVMMENVARSVEQACGRP